MAPSPKENIFNNFFKKIGYFIFQWEFSIQYNCFGEKMKLHGIYCQSMYSLNCSGGCSHGEWMLKKLWKSIPSWEKVFPAPTGLCQILANPNLSYSIYGNARIMRSLI